MFVKKVKHFLLLINRVVILENIVSMGGGLFATPLGTQVITREFIMNKALIKYFLCTILFLLLIGCEQKNDFTEDKSKEKNLTQKDNADTLTLRQKVNSFVLRGNEIEVGMLADDLFTEKANGQKIFKEDEHIGKDVIKDPINPNSLLVTHHYKTDRQTIDIIFARTEDPGPYRIKEIIIQKNNQNDDKKIYKEQSVIDENNKPPTEQRFIKVKKINIAGNEIKIGQEAYIPQGRLESFFIKNEGDILSTHDSYYSVDDKTYIITYGPGEDGPYIVTNIKVSE